MIDCLHFRKHWGKDLDAADSLLMRFHLSVCDACQDYDQRMRTQQSIDGLSAEENPPVEDRPII